MMSEEETMLKELNAEISRFNDELPAIEFLPKHASTEHILLTGVTGNNIITMIQY
jgi:hypothetical protein